MHEVAIPELHSIQRVRATRFMPSDLEVRGRGVDQDCMAGPGTEKFLIDDADPAPDVEKRRASANVWPEHLEKHCRGAIGPLALVPIPVAFGLAMIEDRGESVAAARVHSSKPTRVARRYLECQIQ